MSTHNETDETPAKITWLGRLDGGQPNKHVWSGGISAAPEILKERLKLHGHEEYKAAIGNFYKKIGFKKPVRCIDGRSKQGVLEANDLDVVTDEDLGPQTPGGSVGLALAHRIAEFDYSPGDNIHQDLLDLIERYHQLDLDVPVGSHDDDHAQFPFTGCGAVDRMPDILDRMVDEKALPIIKAYVEATVGNDFSEEAFDAVVHRLKKLNSPSIKGPYLLQRSPDDDYEYRNLTLEALKDPDLTKPEIDEAEVENEVENIETMEGLHNEIFLIVNKMRGTTFNRDLFCLFSRRPDESGKFIAEAQAFNYDYWHTEDRANLVYPDNPKARQLLLITRAMYAVATGMVLTDGSLEVAIRE